MIRTALSAALAVMLLGSGSGRVSAAGDCTAIAYQASLVTAASALRAVPPDVAAAERALAPWSALPPPAVAALAPVQQDLAARPPRTGDATLRLRAMGAALAYPPGTTCNERDAAARAALHDVYAGPAFRQLDAAQTGGFWDAILHALGVGLSAAASALGRGGILLLLIALVALAVAGVVRHRLRRADTRRWTFDAEPAELGQDPDAEWRAAEAAAALNDYREAVRRAFRAALLEVTERGVAFVDAAWTTRELLTRVRADAEVLVALAAAAADFDRAWYSGTVVSAADWALAAEHCRAVRRSAARHPSAR